MSAKKSSQPKRQHKDANLKLIDDLHQRLKEQNTAGSAGAIERQHSKKKLTIPERLDLLFDKKVRRFEIGAFAALGAYEDHGDIRAGGVRTVIGRVSGNDCIVVANDSMVKSGTWFPHTIKKILRAQEVGFENRLPLIYLVDSGGLFLPLQHETFPDHDHAGRIFYNNARISAAGIPQIAAVMGPCVAGGAYLPALCDEILMVKETSGIFLAGPYLVKAAIGEDADQEELGGASMHTQLSGMADYEDDDEESCLARLRRLASQWPQKNETQYNVQEEKKPTESSLLDVMPADPNKGYDMRSILPHIVDGGSWEEYKAEYGKTLVTGTARIKGRLVGVVASQRIVTRSGKGEAQIGGVIYGDASDKAARFILNCNQKQIPLLFWQNVTGFMVGKHAEQNGIIKDGAKLVNAVSNSRVPKITIVMGNSYGAGNYALCGRAYQPRFMIAWPQAKIGVMGGSQAANTILSIEKRKAKGKLTAAQEEKILEGIKQRYEETVSPYYAASQLWIDAIIDPRDTRDTLAQLLDVACADDPASDFKVGVFQV